MNTRTLRMTWLFLAVVVASTPVWAELATSSQKEPPPANKPDDPTSQPVYNRSLALTYLVAGETARTSESSAVDRYLEQRLKNERWKQNSKLLAIPIYAGAAALAAANPGVAAAALAAGGGVSADQIRDGIF